MQLLSKPTNTPGVRICATEMLEAVPQTMCFIRREMRQHRKRLSVSQFRALIWVERHPDNTLSALAEHLTASLPTTSRIVAGLVNKGFITRAGRANDRRQISLAITEKGRSALDPARSATRLALESRLGHLTKEQQAAFLEVMSILKSVFANTSMKD